MSTCAYYQGCSVEATRCGYCETHCGCGIRPGMSELEELLARIDKIEARQYNYDQHDPECPARMTERAQQGTDMYFTPQPCTCWLVQE